MANPFDQFDAAEPSAPALSSNPFDQFDEHPSTSLLQPAGFNAATAEDIGKSAVSGLGKGTVGLAGIPGDISTGLNDLGTWTNRKLEQYFPGQMKQAEERFEAKHPNWQNESTPFPTSGQVIGAVENATGGKFYQPQTIPGRYAETLGEFVPNMVGGGPEGVVSRAATRVLAPALASETAGELTRGTALEPAARVAGAVLGHGAAGIGRPIPEINAPSVEQLHDAAEAGYRNARGYGVEIKSKPVANLANDIFSNLYNDGFRQINVPKTWSVINELKKPPGQTLTIDDLESVRKALNKAGANPMEGAEKEASRRAIGAIDNYLSNLDPAHVAINPQFAGDVAGEISDARANWAAMKRGELVQNKLESAFDQTGATGSGSNINNVTRQKIKQILASPRQLRGFSPAEVAQMRRVVRGTPAGNALRKVGKLAPEGVVSGALGVDLGLAMAGQSPMALGVPLLGKLAKTIADAKTAREARRLSQMVRVRSPIGRPLPQPTPPGPLSIGDYGRTGLLGQSAAQEQARGGRTRFRADGGPADSVDPDLYNDPNFKAALDSLGPAQLPSRLDILRNDVSAAKDYLTPEWAKPSYGYDPAVAESEAKILADPNAVPGKIGPGYGATNMERLGAAGIDAATLLAPELKGALALKGMAAAIPGAARFAGKEVTEEAAPRAITDFTSLLKSHGPEFENATVIDAQGNVLHNPISRESVGGPMLRINADGSVSRGLLAYHGSPHDFDKFDLSQIGTGEGAQAYGHGLYFAENENVAKGYRDALSDRNWLLNDTARNPENQAMIDRIQRLVGKGVSPDDAIPALKEEVRANYQYSQDVQNRTEMPPEWIDRAMANSQRKGLKAQEALDWLNDHRGDLSSGRMYQVAINADPEHFLDWDKPISEQSPKVKAFLKAQGWAPTKFGPADPAMDVLQKNLKWTGRWRGNLPTDPPWANEYDEETVWKTLRDLYPQFSDQKLSQIADEIKWRSQAGQIPESMTGQRLYDVLRQNLGGGSVESPARAMEALRQAGIPGIKYLDQGSRAAGQGSRNYVVFNDKLIDILKKYGLAGMIASGAYHFNDDDLNQWRGGAVGRALGGSVGHMKKIDRSAFLYLPSGKRGKDNAQCKSCILWLRRKRCLIHGPKEEIGGDASCGFYVPGKPALSGIPKALVTPQESGLVRRQVRCENCAHTENGRHCMLYDKLNKALPRFFGLDIKIEPQACCNAQTPK